MDSIPVSKVFRLQTVAEPPPSLDVVVDFVRFAFERIARHLDVEASESDFVEQAKVALYLYERHLDPSLAWDPVPGVITELGMLGFGAIVEFVTRRQTRDSMERVNELNKQISATELAYQRHSTDPKQIAKARVWECWREWQSRKAAGPSPYKSKAAFARDMLEKYPDLASQKVIEDWCREWERAGSINRPFPDLDAPRRVKIHIGK